jgi:hypothetical protein
MELFLRAVYDYQPVPLRYLIQRAKELSRYPLADVELLAKYYEAKDRGFIATHFYESEIFVELTNKGQNSLFGQESEPELPEVSPDILGYIEKQVEHQFVERFIFLKDSASQKAVKKAWETSLLHGAMLLASARGEDGVTKQTIDRLIALIKKQARRGDGNG